MEATGRYLSIVSVVIVFVLTVPASGTSNIPALPDDVISGFPGTLDGRFIRTLTELTPPEVIRFPISAPPLTGTQNAESRPKRFTSAASRGLDSKVSKLKTPSQTQGESDTVPVIRGFAGLSPAEVRALTGQDVDVDDGRLIRTTEKPKSEKNVRRAKTEDDGDVPVITGTRDPNNPSRQDGRYGKSGGEDDDLVVQLNAGNPRPAPVTYSPPPVFVGRPVQPTGAPPPVFGGRPVQPTGASPPVFGGRPVQPTAAPPPGFGGRPVQPTVAPTSSAAARCRQRKLLRELDEQLIALGRINEQRQADIARSLSWVNGAGQPEGQQFTPIVSQVPIPYFPYLSNLPIYYGRSDWTPPPVQIPLSYQVQVNGNRGRNNIPEVYRRNWIPEDSINCDFYEEQEKNLRAPDHRGAPFPPTLFSSTPSPFSSSPPPFSSTPAPFNYNSRDGLRRPLPPPYGRAYRPPAPTKIEVDGKLAKPNEEENEDEEEE